MTTPQSDSAMDFLFGAPAPVKKRSKDNKKSKKVHTTTDPVSSTPLLPPPQNTTQESLSVTTNSFSETSSEEKLVDVDAISWNPFPLQKNVTNFSQLGISSWLVRVLARGQITKPTDIQLRSIPAILKGHNIIARAQTGSGKTAAFALPILEHLSRDPYGIFALVLTPARELALQIEEQFKLFGAPIHLQTSCVIGGLSLVKQGQRLDQRPHVVIATPGRLNDMLSRLGPHAFQRLRYLVFDEVDRLFEPGFAPALHDIMEYLPPVESRQTLFFSATVTTQVLLSQYGVKICTDETYRTEINPNHGTSTETTEKIEKQEQNTDSAAATVSDDVDTEEQDPDNKTPQQIVELPPLIKNPLFFCSGANKDDILVKKLSQYYLCFPALLKEAYIAYLLRFAISADKLQELTRHSSNKDREMNTKDKKKIKQKVRPTRPGSTSALLNQASQIIEQQQLVQDYLTESSHPMIGQQSCIVFTKKCRTAAILSLFLREIGIPNVSLHSKIKQSLRLSNLQKFRQGRVQVLIATDVAARGLDIPHVSCVINYDLPYNVEDYVHRIGRTARANRSGMSISFVTQYDTEQIKAIEDYTKVTMTQFSVNEDFVVEDIRNITEVKNLSQLRYEEQQEHELASKGRD